MILYRFLILYLLLTKKAIHFRQNSILCEVFRKENLTIFLIQIKTQKDILTLIENSSFDFSYSSYVADYFSHLMKTFSDGAEPDDFSLGDTGHIIILKQAMQSSPA